MMSSLFSVAGVTLINQDGLPNVQTNPQNGTPLIQIILTILFSFTGVISLLMMVIAGFRYITAAGDTNEIAKARRQILYTAIGLIVSLMAAVLVTFVLGSVHL